MMGKERGIYDGGKELEKIRQRRIEIEKRGREAWEGD